jgi:hypothetical protein
MNPNPAMIELDAIAINAVDLLHASNNPDIFQIINFRYGVAFLYIQFNQPPFPFNIYILLYFDIAVKKKIRSHHARVAESNYTPFLHAPLRVPQ